MEYMGEDNIGFGIDEIVYVIDVDNVGVITKRRHSLSEGIKQLSVLFDDGMELWYPIKSVNTRVADFYRESGISPKEALTHMRKLRGMFFRKRQAEREEERFKSRDIVYHRIREMFGVVLYPIRHKQTAKLEGCKVLFEDGEVHGVSLLQLSKDLAFHFESRGYTSEQATGLVKRLRSSSAQHIDKQDSDERDLTSPKVEEVKSSIEDENDIPRKTKAIEAELIVTASLIDRTLELGLEEDFRPLSKRYNKLVKELGKRNGTN